MSMVNASDKYFYLNADGEVIEGDANAPAEAVTLLCAPGGTVDDDLVRAHELGDRLTSPADVTYRHALTGEEILLRGNRAFAPHLIAPLPRSRITPPARTVLVGGREDGGDVPGRESGALAASPIHPRDRSEAQRTVDSRAQATEAKAVRQADVEDKGMPGPAPAAAPRTDDEGKARGLFTPPKGK
jgi:hypothetical protein